MPFTILDIVLLVVMLVSGLLAMIRGFIREVLSIAAWGIAAVATLYGFNKLTPIVQQYINNDIIAKGVTVGGLFLGTLLLVTIVTVRISDMILDSRIGALDRTLGFLFGLARGLIIVVIAYAFFDWLVPEDKKPAWVQNAKSQIVLKTTGESLKAMLPDDPEDTILRRLKKPKPEDEADAPAPAPRSTPGTPGPRTQ